MPPSRTCPSIRGARSASHPACTRRWSRTRAASTRAIADSYRHLNVDVSVREAARTISVPTMMVCGSYEKRFAPHRDYAAENIPGLRVMDLPAGHAVNAERHEEFNAAVAAFLRSGIGESHDVGHAPDPGRGMPQVRSAAPGVSAG